MGGEDAEREREREKTFGGAWAASRQCREGLDSFRKFE